MSKIDLNSCTMDDVIAYSMAHHTDSLKARMIELASLHRDASYRFKTERAYRDAQMLCAVCQSAEKWIHDPQRELTFGERLELFSAAAYLQHISRAARSQICKRDDDSRA